MDDVADYISVSAAWNIELSYKPETCLYNISGLAKLPARHLGEPEICVGQLQFFDLHPGFQIGNHFFEWPSTKGQSLFFNFVSPVYSILILYVR